MSRTETTTRELFTFDELEDSAKERAREWWRGIESQEFDAEYVIEDAATVADILGLDIRQRVARLGDGTTRHAPSVYWSGFYSQGDGASFDARYSYARGSARRIREYAPQDPELHRIAATLAEVQRRYFYSVWAAVKQSGHYQHEMTMQFDIGAESRDVSADDEETLKDAIRDFARWIYRRLEAEYEWRLADEQVDDAIRANEYEFDADGGAAH